LTDKATPTAFLSVHFLLAVQKKVNMRFYFLVVQKESVNGFSLLFSTKSGREDFSEVQLGVRIEMMRNEELLENNIANVVCGSVYYL